ncbi:hypothetical protein SLS62_006690 [Diatrype stigma]|uniref:Uncharacterized protein n=1 Tax=Diatrype stigma TaxID=117547 RepID=A0AAN9UMD6_9PEZI
MRGIRTVFKASWDLLIGADEPKSSIMAPIQSSPTFPDPDVLLFSSKQLDSQRLSYLLSPTEGLPVGDDDVRFFDDEGGEGDQSDEILHAYRQAAACIGSMHATATSPEHPLALSRRLLCFVCLVPEGFLNLVARRKR